MVEFALVIPIFLLVLTGILDFGFMLFTRMSVINAAREGARVGVMTADPATIAGSSGVITSRVISAAAAAGLTVNPSDVTIACLQTTVSNTSPPTCNWSPYSAISNPTGAQQGDSVKVTVNHIYTPFFPLRFGLSFDLSSTVQMVLDSVTSG